MLGASARPLLPEANGFREKIRILQVAMQGAKPGRWSVWRECGATPGVRGPDPGGDEGLRVAVEVHQTIDQPAQLSAGFVSQQDMAARGAGRAPVEGEFGQLFQLARPGSRNGDVYELEGFVVAGGKAMPVVRLDEHEVTGLQRDVITAAAMGSRAAEDEEHFVEIVGVRQSERFGAQARRGSVK